MDVTTYGKGLWELLIWINIRTGGDNEPQISKNGGKFFRLAAQILASKKGFFLVPLRHETESFKDGASLGFIDTKATQE